jgi:hypothetical protein
MGFALGHSFFGGGVEYSLKWWEFSTNCSTVAPKTLALQREVA